jgi:hypothetical protein
MIRLVRQYPDGVPQLTAEVVERAEGVFLWVRLVVRDLIQSLENGDNLEELRARLMALPSDLRHLYKRMFEKMSVEYQKESAIMFQLNEKWLGISHDQSLPGLLMWFAINNPDAGLKLPVGHMSLDQHDWGMTSLVKRIQSRCCGLLEVRGGGRTLDSLSSIFISRDDVSIDEISQLAMTYLHRTVHEFITVDEVWKDICDLTIDMCFSISTRLASACLSAIKLAKNITLYHTRYVAIIEQLCQEVADVSPETAHTYLMDLDRTMSTLGADNGRVYDGAYMVNSHLHHRSLAFIDVDNLTTMLDHEILDYASVYTNAASRALLCHSMPSPPEIDLQYRFGIVLQAYLS